MIFSVNSAAGFNDTGVSEPVSQYASTTMPVVLSSLSSLRGPSRVAGFGNGTAPVPKSLEVSTISVHFSVYISFPNDS